MRSSFSVFARGILCFSSIAAIVPMGCGGGGDAPANTSVGLTEQDKKAQDLSVEAAKETERQNKANAKK